MKYIVLVGDGMADYPVAELDGRTPLEAAKTPHMDYIASAGQLGRVNTIPDNMSPASDVANISILGYDPQQFYSGRGSLEAANLGVTLEEDDVAFRCNLITVEGDTLVDYSAGHISSKEAADIIHCIDAQLGSQRIKFYPGVSYRHLMVVKGGALQGLHDLACKPPHDITGQDISKNLPRGKKAEEIIQLMEQSRAILAKHDINQVRIDLKENPANMIWLWGQGKKPAMPKFVEKFNITGSVISAVDLIKGLGRILGLDVINVKGATGYYDTNYEGKAKAALQSLRHHDFVFVHVEAPDEAGHNGDLREKITAIERFDQFVVGAFLQAFKNKPDFRLLVLPDHATPVALKTHVAGEVCFGLIGKGIAPGHFAGYSEKEALRSSLEFPKGHELLEYVIKSS
ncbi:MAG: cofactor-independent phosphoglycerate mutase [Candidatus Omnitrophica bacterium]|nr:cofactor-independent phosphoglycerate mutase [Candidatus Omnitrophota bacterium]